MVLFANFQNIFAKLWSNQTIAKLGIGRQTFSPHKMNSIHHRSLAVGRVITDLACGKQNQNAGKVWI